MIPILQDVLLYTEYMIDWLGKYGVNLERGKLPTENDMKAAGEIIAKKLQLSQEEIKMVEPADLLSYAPFIKADKDEDGKLTKGEVKELLKGNMKCTEEDLYIEFNKQDKDHDQKINYNEYNALLKEIMR